MSEVVSALAALAKNTTSLTIQEKGVRVFFSPYDFLTLGIQSVSENGNGT